MDPNVLFEIVRSMGLPLAVLVLLVWQQRHSVSRRQHLRDVMEIERRAEHWRERALDMADKATEIAGLARDVAAKVPRRPRTADTSNVDAAGSVHVSAPLREKAGPPFKPPTAVVADTGRHGDDLEDMPCQGAARGGVPMPAVEWSTAHGRKACVRWLSERRERRRNEPPPPMDRPGTIDVRISGRPPAPPDFDWSADVRCSTSGPQHPNDPDADRWEWIETTTFGDPEPTYMRGRYRRIPPPGPRSTIMKSSVGPPPKAPPESNCNKDVRFMRRAAPSFRPNRRLSNPAPMFASAQQTSPWVVGSVEMPLDPVARLLIWLFGL